MAYDLQEQEEIEGFKAFWQQYGNLLMTVVTVILLAFAAWMGWNRYQASQAADAAQAYGQLVSATQTRDIAKIKDAAGTVFEKYGSTIYGQMAALLAAKAYADAGDLKAASAPLQWATEHARDEPFRQIARIRLAGVLLDQKSYDEALKVLAASGDDPAFAGLIADRRGDVLTAQGKTGDAKAAYTTALDKLDAASPMRRIVEAKLDGLTGAGS